MHKCSALLVNDRSMTVFSVPSVVQLWQSLCNSRPLPPHNWPCRHIQCGDYGKSMRPPPVSVCTPSERSQHRHTRLTVQNNDQRLQQSLVFIYVFIHQSIYFLSCYLAPPGGAEQCCKSPACGNLLKHLVQQIYVMPCKFTSCTINLTQAPPEMRMSDYCSVFLNINFAPYITTTFPSFLFILYHSTHCRVSWIILIFFLHSAKPNLKGWSWIVNVCF